MTDQRQQRITEALRSIGVDINALRSTSSAGDAAAIAAGSTLGLEQQLLANDGQPARTVLAVGSTSTGKVQGVSLAPGNTIQTYLSGDDFNQGRVLHREFMRFGEPICFTGLQNGSIITSTGGFYGDSEQVDGGDASPMSLLSYGLSFRRTFFFGFRNCDGYFPGAVGANQGWVHIVNGPLASAVQLLDGIGNVIRGQTGIQLRPWQYARLYTDGNQEYVIDSTNPVMSCHNAAMDLNPVGRFADSRLVMPLTNDGITWGRSGFISAPFDNTQVDWYRRTGTRGTLNNGLGVSPGSPVDFDAAPPVGTGASDLDYEPNGAVRLRATGFISAYSGADSSGLEASPLMPRSAMSQVVAQPLYLSDTGDGGSNGVAITSPFEGTASVFEWDASTDSLSLAYTVPLRRGITAVTRDDQNVPAAGVVANETVEGAVELVGDLGAGVVVADVPVSVVSQGRNPSGITLRSQNGTTTTPIGQRDDETLQLGHTPEELRAEIRQGVDGLLYRRVVDAGNDTWASA